MKRTEQDKQIEKRLCEGEWTLHGCLGDDPLGLDRIEVDRARIQKMGLDLDESGRMLEGLWQEGARRFGTPTALPGGVSLIVEEAKGSMACPFGHPGTFPKGRMIVSFGSRKLHFSPLSIHMLTAHGFLGGVGSGYRVEPNDLSDLTALLNGEQNQQGS